MKVIIPQKREATETENALTTNPCHILFNVFSGPPDFVVEPKDTVVEEGQTMVMDCAVQGEPIPSIRWQKGRKKLKDEGRLTIMANNSLRWARAAIRDWGAWWGRKQTSLNFYENENSVPYSLSLIKKTACTKNQRLKGPVGYPQFKEP